MILRDPADAPRGERLVLSLAAGGLEATSDGPGGEGSDAGSPGGRS